MEHPHRKRAGTYGGVKYLEFRNRSHDPISLSVVEPLVGIVGHLRIIQQIVQPLLPEFRIAIRWAHLSRQRRYQCLLHHIVHDGARRVVGAGLFAGRLAGFRVVCRQQVLKHLAQQFGIQRDLRLYRCVFLNRELVVFQQGNRPSSLSKKRRLGRLSFL